jgi:hypothetical protein
MRLLLKHLFVIACLYLLSACNKRLDNYDLDYSGDRLVVFGNISNEAGVTIYLTHTLPPTGTYYLNEIDVNVSDAIITLIENNVIVDTLIEFEPGYYGSAFLPTPGNFYSIKAIADGFDTVYSESVLFPQPVNLDEVVYETDFENINGDPAFSLKPVFTDDPLTDNFYTFGFRFFFEDTIILNDIFESPDDAPFGCSPGVFKFNDTFLKLYADNCFAGTTFPFKFICSKVYYQEDIVPFEKCEFDYNVTSSELFDYVANVSETQGIELLLSDPKINYTNITNGFGVFWAQNSETFTYYF